MKNPYALYYREKNGTESQVAMSKKVQKAITSVLTGIIRIAQKGKLNQWIIEDAGKKIRKIHYIRISGGLDTTSRERMWERLKNRLEDETEMDKKEIESLCNNFWDTISGI